MTTWKNPIATVRGCSPGAMPLNRPRKPWQRSARYSTCFRTSEQILPCSEWEWISPTRSSRSRRFLPLCCRLLTMAARDSFSSHWDKKLSLPTIQAGTDVFGADCFSQVVDGPSLDAQMHGALSDAAGAEGQVSNRVGGCVIDPSYVVPSMVSGAMIAYRFEQLLAQGDSPMPPPPLRWRQGALPSDCGNPNHEHDIDSSELCGLAAETCG